jgi:hypothetical protein
MIAKHRKAFSMLTAIIVIVLMATVAIYIMNLSGKMVKETTIQYQREQAMLLAKSYTEYAIMAVMANDRNSSAEPCLYTIKGDIGSSPSTGDGYRARVHLSYIGTSSEVGTCGGRILSQAVTTATTPLTVLIDVYIDYKDPDNTAGKWRTYHQRTLQKI